MFSTKRARGWRDGQAGKERSRIEVDDGRFDEQFDRLARDDLPAPEAQAWEVAALGEFVEEVVGHAEGLCGLGDREHQRVGHVVGAGERPPARLSDRRSVA